MSTTVTTPAAEPVRWGILGAASIVDAMAPALHSSPHATLVAIASRSPQRAEEAAQRHGAQRAVVGYELLLADPQIEAVYIALPNSLHAEWVIAALAAGKHVLCEKPMTVTADEARAIEAANTGGLLVAEAFMYAHHPRFAAVRELIAAGEIGDIRTIITTFSFDASEELDHSGFQGMPGSGAIYDVGCYAVHSARMLLQREPVAVTAHGEISQLHGSVDLTTSALVEFEGATLLMHVGMAGADTDTIEVIGATGRILVPHAFLCGPEDGDIVVVTGDQRRVLTAAKHNHYVDQVDAFSRALRSGGSLPGFDTRDAIAGATVLEALSRSVREGVRVTL